MIANTCTTSTEQQLAAIGDLLTVLGATASSSGMDLALTHATTLVERLVTGAAAGSIRRSVVRETVAGSGSPRLMLSRTPVLKVGRIFDSTATSEATEYCSTAFRVENPDAGFVELTNDAGFAWTATWDTALELYPRPNAARRTWLVEYEAGWQYACTSSTSNDWLTTTTGRTLPDDVERAVLLKAAEIYQGNLAGVEWLKVGPLSLNFRSEAADPVLDLLAPWRRI